MTRHIKVLVVEPGTAAPKLRTVDQELATFNGLVGGPIEGLSLGEGVSAYFNEEGKGLGLPVNGMADYLIRALLRHDGRRLLPGDVIVGPVVFMGQPDAEGYDTDVPDELLETVRAFGLEIEEVPGG